VEDEMKKQRCPWSGEDPLYVAYHDTEWGVPVHDDRTWFEFLVLEGAQAGLSWLTILRKRKAYKEAFADFYPARVARFDERDIERLLGDPGIVRNRRKIESAIGNAQAFLKIQEEFTSFDSYIWEFVDGRPIQNSWRALQEIPVVTEEAKILSQDLKRRGFSFIGPTICYAHMQATGMVNDHLISCFRHAEVKQISEMLRGKGGESG
jgi:DNA-3-methyladenine glycosylase I